MLETDKILLTMAISLFLIGLTACSNSTGNSSGAGDTSSNSVWIIPRDQVVDGGVGRDGIPAIDKPSFSPVSEIDFVNDDRLVVGIRIGAEVRAYPHQILDWHEIVNDKIGDRAFALTYCPLTNTAIGWNRTINGEETTFGVSGLLFRNNLVPFDRATNSNWSQMQMRSVNGELIRQQIEILDLVETTWASWKELYPDSQILNTDTGFERNYGGFAYGRNYLTSHSDIRFPRQHTDSRLGNKERVHGVIVSDTANESADVRVYVIDELGSGISVIADSFGGMDLIVVGSAEKNIAASFKSVLEDGTRLTFEPVQGAFPAVMEDQEGSRWDIFGYAVSGPRTGERLTPTNSYTGYWFAWADFFPGLEIFEGHQPS